MNTEEILRSNLTDEQYEAVIDKSRNILCIACAGSGKSRTLAYKIAYLISEGETPESIIAFTFTEKAAESIKRRVAEALRKFDLSENIVGSMFIGTLDAFCQKLLGDINAKYRQFDILDQNRLILYVMSRQYKFGIGNGKGYFKRIGFSFDLPQATHDKKGNNGLRRWKTVREAIGDLPVIKAGEEYKDDGVVHNHKCAGLSDKNLKRIKAIRANGGSRDGLPQELILECHKKKDKDGKVFSGHGDVYGIMDPDKPSPTITGGCLCYSKGRYGHYSQNRAISIREAARLQTFPDDFIFSNSLKDSALQIGNAVPIDLVKASGEVFKEAIKTIKINRSKSRKHYNRKI